jgi:hypothetical protein
MDNGFPVQDHHQGRADRLPMGRDPVRDRHQRPDLFQTCPAGSASQSDTPKTSANNPPKKKKKRCPAGEYLNQLGACQPNETGQ